MLHGDSILDLDPEASTIKITSTVYYYWYVNELSGFKELVQIFLFYFWNNQRFLLQLEWQTQNATELWLIKLSMLSSTALIEYWKNILKCDIDFEQIWIIIISEEKIVYF